MIQHTAILTEAKFGEHAVSFEDVLEVVFKSFNVSYSDMLHPQRTDFVARARMATAYLLRTYTSYSYPQIGLLMQRDHTSILHQHRRAIELMADNSEFRHKVFKCHDLIKQLRPERQPSRTLSGFGSIPNAETPSGLKPRGRPASLAGPSPFSEMTANAGFEHEALTPRSS